MPREIARQASWRGTVGAVLVFALASVALVLDLGAKDSGPPLGPDEGWLVVSTLPRVDTVIFVDGVARNTGAIRGLPLVAGEHLVCFGPVDGYLEPPCEAVTLRSGRRTKLLGRFEPVGKLGTEGARCPPAAQVVTASPLPWGLEL